MYKHKPDCHKACLVFLGNTQKESDYAEMNAPVASFKSIQMLCSEAAANDWDCHWIDVQNAFMNADLDHVLYMECSEGHGKPGMVCKLKKALYGC